MVSRKRRIDDEGADAPQKKRRETQPTSFVTTRGASRRSLSDAVFLTTELLEDVLRFLPMKDLLLAQRVCRKWKVVIADSIVLQQALFFVPEEPKCRWRCIFEPSGTSRLAKVEPNVELGQKCFVERTMDSGRLNNLLFEHEVDETIIERAKLGIESVHYRLPLLKEASKASWQRMLVTQSPMGEIEFLYRFETREGRRTKHRAHHEVKTRSDGITVRDVMDIGRQVEREHGKLTWVDVFLCGTGMILPTAEEQDAMEEHDGKLWPKSPY